MYSGYYIATSKDFIKVNETSFVIRKDSKFYDKWESFFNNPKPIRLKLEDTENTFSWLTFHYCNIGEVEGDVYDNLVYLSIYLQARLIITHDTSTRDLVLLIESLE